MKIAVTRLAGKEKNDAAFAAHGTVIPAIVSTLCVLR